MRSKSGFSLAAAGLAVVILDRLSKAWASAALKGRGAVPALPGILNWKYAENTGAAFSAFRGTGPLLAVITIALLAGVAAYLFLARPRSGVRWGLGLVLAGGLSNLYDRLVFGYVVDFIDFAFVRFAVFNVADAAITLGAGIALLSYCLAGRREAKEDGPAA